MVLTKMLKIAKIVTDQAGEVNKHFADLIFFQGCDRKCGYCFNPELIPYNGGDDLTQRKILESLGTLSDVVVLTGGEPLYQHDKVGLFRLITSLKFKGKYVILETSRYDPMINPLCDKVLYTIKTFDPDFYLIKKLNQKDNTDFCIVLGHDWFDWNNFKKIVSVITKDIYFRFFNNIPVDFREVYNHIESQNKKFKVLYRIVI